ncbi:hypothetical protein HMPREF9248_0878 [Fannyhessea vaginae PB189-T1-4]|uniref:Uncharacterized protein n=1 Tax=Fannyhessea vaginae PB189-T1-4 TaxID=866774 RepID=A0ABN0B0E4_9ACTN|nr:hypothetical protein HMPREF9248_0878 [Fannyhessea vaginae PB189-T1-4]
MPGFSCSDCVFCNCMRNKKSGLYQATCTKGYTLGNPHIDAGTDAYFALTPSGLVPKVDPFGNEYLRTDNVCHQFQRAADAPEHVQARTMLAHITAAVQRAFAQAQHGRPIL